MASAGTVTLELDANSVKLLRELKKSQDATRKTATSMRKSMTNSFSAIRSAMIAAFSVQTLRSIANAGLEMERMQRSLKFVTGSSREAAKEMSFLRESSKRLGVDLQSAGTAYTKLSAAAKGTVLQGQSVRDIFTSVSKASVVMGLSSEQTEGALRALEQMISKGTVQAEELRGQLGERLPGAFQIAARAMGKTTQELGKMLEGGEVLASDLLPKLAKELDSLFDSEIDGAANSAQAAFARLSTATFELKAAFAESGLLDIFASLAGHLTTSANAVGGALTTTLEETAANLRSKIEKLVDQRDSKFTGASRSAELNDEINRLAAILSLTEDRLEIEGRVKNQLQEIIALPRQQSEAFTSLFKTEKELAEEYAKELATLQTRFQTAEEEAQKLRATLNKFKKDLSPGQIANFEAAIFDGLDEIEVKVHKVSQTLQNLWGENSEMSESAKQAARNIQDAFAEFLFDPFDKGVKGMLEGFLTAIRRMIANQAAAQIFGSGSGFASFFSGLFGGARATGGPVSGGSTYMVGERGPELFTPGSSGVITPNNRLSSGGVVVQQSYHIEAGADWATLSKVLPDLFDQNREQTKAEIQDLMRRGQFA